MTGDTERAERLRAAVEAMPPGPSRARFATLAETMGRLAAPAPVPAPAVPAPTVPSPRRLLSLDDEVLPDDDVLPALDSPDDEVPIGQWLTWAPPVTRRPVDEPPEDEPPEDDERGVEVTAPEPAGDEPRAPLRIPATRPSPANQPAPPPERPRRWRRRRSP